jgi:peptidoglycan/xylan/chitin deacetylase (PgdA/CDA1 family)
MKQSLQNNHLKILTSWDDGHPLDLKLAGLLDKYKIEGIFYIPKNNPEGPVISPSQIRQLAKKFEIGAHTINHVDLTQVNFKTAKKEIEESKKWLENLLGKPIKKFCYPKGKYNQQILALVKNAGFSYARTTKQFEIHPQLFPPLEQPTTIRIGEWEKSYLKRFLVEKYFLNLKLARYFLKRKKWPELAREFFNQAKTGKDVFHLWGHSWEIESEKNWKNLENLLKIITGK